MCACHSVYMSAKGQLLGTGSNPVGTRDRVLEISHSSKLLHPLSHLAGPNLFYFLTSFCPFSQDQPASDKFSVFLHLRLSSHLLPPVEVSGWGTV